MTSSGPSGLTSYFAPARCRVDVGGAVFELPLVLVPDFLPKKGFPMSNPVSPCSCFAADAWADAAAKYPVGGVVRGVVGAVTPYGVFVQIAEDVDGLVHATDPGLVLLGVPDVGAEVNVRIDLFDSARRRVGLALVGR